MYAAGTVLKLSDGICYTLGNIVYPRLQPTTNPVTVLGTYSACSSCPENSTVTLVISGISLCTGCYATGDIITYDGQDPLGFVTWGDSITGFNGYASGTGSSIFDAPYGPPSWSAALNGGSISYYSKLYQENCQANGYSFGGPAVGYPEIYLTLVGNVLTAEIRGVTPYYNSYRIFHGSTTLTSCRSVVITNDLTCSGAPGWDYRYDNDHPELCYYWPNAGSGGTITISLE
jgi:hypothetical protein